MFENGTPGLGSSALTTRPLLFRHGQVNQTFYTDIIIQMQYTFQKLVLGQVLNLDDRIK